jgi:hypothetical protein
MENRWTSEKRNYTKSGQNGECGKMKKGEGKTESEEITGRRNKEKERERKEGEERRGKGARRKIRKRKRGEMGKVGKDPGKRAWWRDKSESSRLEN